jgi:hypothetical protein
MTSDLPAEAGPLGPGVDELLSVLTAAPAAAELAGEHDTLAMFRANFSPPPASAEDRQSRRQPGELPAATARRTTTARRAIGSPRSWPVRGVVTAAAAVLLCGGTAVAAYATALPDPVQHLAHDVFGPLGVPDTSRQQAPSVPPGQAHHAGPGRRRAHGGASPRPSASASATPTPSASLATPPANSGSSLLSASASALEVSAGSPVVIDGQLTRSGAAVAGAAVRLLERFAGSAVWRVAGTAQTNSTGNVAITVPSLTTNAVVRLASSAGVHSSGEVHSVGLHIFVVPEISIMLKTGAKGRDTVSVSTGYARPGNVVLLQVEGSGGWTYLREKSLSGAGTTSFRIRGGRYENQVIRVVLVATSRHARAVSNAEQVPPPA